MCVNDVFGCWLCDAESPVWQGLSVTSEGAETGRISGAAKGRIALTNPTLLATISTQPKGA